MECRLIEAGGGGRCSARWLELDAIAARLRRYLGDSDPGAYPIDFFLSRPEGFGARGAAAEAAFGRLSAEERDEVVAALAAEFKAGERERLSCWNAGRGSVCGVPFPGWEDWVREGRVLLFEGDLEELRSGPARGAGGGGKRSRDGRRRGARRERRGEEGMESEDDGDGPLCEHHGARGFDHPPDYQRVRRPFCEEDGVCEGDGF